MSTRHQPQRSTAIKYINPALPDVAVPDYAGARYRALVPDTLDLQDRCALGLNALTAPTDPAHDYEIYWWVNFNTNPPTMKRSEESSVVCKFMESVPLLRLASGTDLNAHVEQRYMEKLLQMQGPDGLIYLPNVGRPWVKESIYGKYPPGDHMTVPAFLGRFWNAITIYGQITGEKVWRDAGQRVLEGMLKLCKRWDGKASMPALWFGPGGVMAPQEEGAGAHNAATWVSWVVQALAYHQRFTGDERAGDLAIAMSRWIEEDLHHFDDQGRFLPEFSEGVPTPFGRPMIHFHGHTMVLLAVLEAGLAVGDQRAIDFAHRGFKYAMSEGECTLGCFREILNWPMEVTTEMCEVADMIALAVKLSRCGAGDYWDLADRWTRNMLAEGQLRRADWVHWISQRMPATPVPEHHCGDHAIERNLGAFGGWVSPNEFLPDAGKKSPLFAGFGIMHCCTGNATRTLYYVWENTLRHEAGKLRVNLLLNRASPWVDVESHIPYTGRVDVRVKQPVDLSVRIPEWVTPAQVKCEVDGAERRASFTGRYCEVGPARPGQVVTLTFPIAEHAELIHYEKRTYRIVRRGSTCVAIDPPGVNGPLFQRDHLRDDATRFRYMDRFVSDTTLDW